MRTRVFPVFALILPVLASAPLSVFASGESAAPPRTPPPVIAEVESAGGLMPPMPCFPTRTGIRIHEGGLVVSFADANTARVLTLSEAATERLQSEILGIEAAPLRDVNEGEPLCMDAPSTTYSIFQMGQRIAIASRQSCHDYLMTNWQGQEIKRVLDALLELRSLAGPAHGCPKD